MRLCNGHRHHVKKLTSTFLLAAAVCWESQLQAAPSVQDESFTDLGELRGSPLKNDAPVVSADGTVIVGKSPFPGGETHAFRWTAAGITDLGTNGGTTSIANAVSADGSVVVGKSTLSTYVSFHGIFMFQPNHAFRWTAAGMADLGTLGGSESTAVAVSADGAVVAGQSDLANGRYHAFRWTAAGMVDLGALDGSYSYVTGISADGAVLVGDVRRASGLQHAFRWTAAGMVDLGLLTGDDSNATAVSADGTVVVGRANLANLQTRAFRWTSAGMVDLGTFGGNYSYATDVSANGAVTIGQAELANGQRHAFRWTSAGLTDLGTLGGTTSIANGVSADGSVVVGEAFLATGNAHAFRWTADGMIDLGTFGGPNSKATSVSADGNVVVGFADTAAGQSHAFLYRSHALLDVEAWLASVGGNSRTYNIGTTLAGLPLEGAHHRPMLSFDRMGKDNQAWATGDFGSSSRTRDVHVTTGEAGINWNVGKTGLFGFAAGHGEQNADLAANGSSSTKGDYALAEYDYRPEGTQWIVSLIGMVGSWESRTSRGYLTGTGPNFSVGTSGLITRTARLRVDAPAFATFGGFGFAPYASYAVTQTIAGAYVETGGDFPASFDEQKHNSIEGRLGVTVSKDLSDTTKLLLTVEAIHRFDGAGPGLTGQDVTGGIAFSLPGAAPRPDCVRFGFDIDHKLNANTLLNVSAHAATVGEAHDVSAAISIRRAF